MILMLPASDCALVGPALPARRLLGCAVSLHEVVGKHQQRSRVLVIRD
jgi:hypothetical protein